MFGLNLVKAAVHRSMVAFQLIIPPMTDSIINRYKDSLEYKKWKIARFFTLYCDSPTNPEEITEDAVADFEKVFDAKEPSEDVSILLDAFKSENTAEEDDI